MISGLGPLPVCLIEKNMARQRHVSEKHVSQQQLVSLRCCNLMTKMSCTVNALYSLEAITPR